MAPTERRIEQQKHVVAAAAPARAGTRACACVLPAKQRRHRRQARQRHRHDVDDPPHTQPRAARSRASTAATGRRLVPPVKYSSRSKTRGRESFSPFPTKRLPSPFSFFQLCDLGRGHAPSGSRRPRRPAAARRRPVVLHTLITRARSSRPISPAGTRAVPMKHAARSADQVAGGASMSPARSSRCRRSNRR